MFALVKYSGGSYDVCISKNISTKQNTCSVRCGGARFEAILLDSNDDKNHLLDMKKKLNAHCFNYNEPCSEAQIKDEVQAFLSNFSSQNSADVSVPPEERHNDTVPKTKKRVAIRKQSKKKGEAKVLRAESKNTSFDPTNDTPEHKNVQAHETRHREENYISVTSEMLPAGSDYTNSAPNNNSSESQDKNAQTHATRCTEQDSISVRSEMLSVEGNYTNPDLTNNAFERQDENVQTHETRCTEQNLITVTSEMLPVESNYTNSDLTKNTFERQDENVQTHETRYTEQNSISVTSEMLLVESNYTIPDLTNNALVCQDKNVQTHETECTELNSISLTSEMLPVESNYTNPDPTNDISRHEVQTYIPVTSEMLLAESNYTNPDLTNNAFECQDENAQAHETRCIEQTLMSVTSEILIAEAYYTDPTLANYASEHDSELQLSATDIISNSYIPSEPSITLQSDDPIWAEFDKSVVDDSDKSAESDSTRLMSQTNKALIPNRNTNDIIESESDDDDGSDYNLEKDDVVEDSSDVTDIDDADDEAEICTPNRSVSLSRSKNHSTDGSFNLSSTSNVPGTFACDDFDMTVAPSTGPQGAGKTYFCFYCHKKTTKLARHLERVHKDEEDVKKFIALPKKTAERAELIKNLRNKGNFLHNKNADLNHGELIVCRRPQKKMKKNAQDFVACPKCKGFFARSNVRHHFQHCAHGHGKNTRSILASGRKILGRVHPDASKKLRKRIIPIMREDNIVRLIRYDQLITLYGNKMCRKYRSQHQDDMIRAHLRLLGRFLTVIKTIKPELTDFASLYDPKYYDAAIQSVNNLAGFNEETETYKHPSVASSIGTMVKKIGAILETECIKQHNNEKKNNAADFLKLLNEDFGCSVGKTVIESQVKHQRQKKIELPVTEDITKLNTFLNKKRESAHQSLRQKFTFEAWLSLAQSILILVQVFNRRRAGEIERVTLDDFNSYKGADEMDKDLFASLSIEKQEAAKKYVRFTIRGKLNRTVPVLLSTEILDSMKIIIKFRSAAKVPQTNPYVFGLPNGNDNNRHLHLRACNLMRKFSEECLAKNAKTLRGTILRKHVATKCASMDLPANEISDIANFMGHHENIHTNIYRQPVASRDIVRMSQVLEQAEGTSSHAGQISRNFPEETSMEDNESCTIICNKDKDREHKAKRNINDELDDAENLSSHNLSENSNASNSGCNDMETDEQLVKKRKKEPSSNKKQTKKRSTSPFGKTKRRRWSDDEVEAGLDMFGENISQSIIPSLRVIEKKIAKHARLKTRNSRIVKAWINNQIKKKEKLDLRKKNHTHKENNSPSLDSTVDSNKQCIKSIFLQQIKRKCIPTSKECENAGRTSEALRQLSVRQMQALVFQEIQNNT